jgi:hypothetical protein
MMLSCVAVLVGALVTAMSFARDPAHGGPPAAAAVAVLRGGPFDGIAFEIEAGQTVIEPKVLAEFAEGAASRDGLGRYVYSGSLDDSGRAVFRYGPGSS